MFFGTLLCFTSTILTFSTTQGTVVPADNDESIAILGVNYTELLPLVDGHVPVTNERRHYIIIGAGMAGLAAADLLKRSGHEVTILEASDRVGGRIETYRDPLDWHSELGAMQILPSHYLVQSYIERENIQTQPFIYYNPNVLYYFNGVKATLEEVENNVNVLKFPGLLPNETSIVTDKGVFGLIQTAINPILRDYKLYGWNYVVDKYDEYSIHEYLSYALSPGAVNMVERLTKYKWESEGSVLAFVRANLHDEVISEHQMLTDGTDALPKALYKHLKDDVILNAQVTAITQNKDDVIVEYINMKTSETKTISGDRVIVTVTAKACKLIQFEPSLSVNKQQVMEVHYVPSIKVFLYFTQAFWNQQGIYGGRSLTDSPLESVYYPSFNLTSGGVVLAAYTSGEGTRYWRYMNDEEAKQMALVELGKLHGRDLSSMYVNGVVKRWHNDKYAHDAYTVFLPNQEKYLYKESYRPEGRVHFAGEHTSLMHGWIEGAVVSGLRAAKQVLHA